MYRPQQFDVVDRVSLFDLIDGVDVAHLVTSGDNGLTATVLPLLLDREDGPNGTLLGHLARPNPQWQDSRDGADALAIFAGPDAYISPSFYPSKREHGRVVPTWNYVTVHAHGKLIIHDDADWVARLVRRLTDKHEHARSSPWSVDNAPDDFLDALYRQIVGVELRITRLEGKRKLSQNRPAADIAGVIENLSSGTGTERSVAAFMIDEHAPEPG